MFRLLLLTLLISAVPVYSTPAGSDSDFRRCGMIPIALHEENAARFSGTAYSDLPLTRVSPSGRFKVHYTLYGDSATTGSFVDSSLAILDAMWRLQVDSLGFRAPPLPADGFIHLSILNLGTYYGATIPESYNGERVPASILCDNDFSEQVFTTHGLDALRVTLAHEFQHVIQFGYRADPFQLMFYEWFATWMEDVAFDSINDYIAYLDVLFENPRVSLFRYDGRREYAASLFAFLLDKAYGRQIILDGWSRFAETGENLFSIFISELEAEGVGEKALAAKFMAWCAFTGGGSVSGFGFKDAALFPELDSPVFLEGAGSFTEFFGEWGFAGVRVPGGFAGDPGLKIFPEDVLAGVVAARRGKVVSYLSSGEPGALFGEDGFAGMLALTDDTSPATLSLQPELPTLIEISPAFPNPSNSVIHWDIALDHPGVVEVELYSLLGRRLMRQQVEIGWGSRYRFIWRGTDFAGRQAASGWYILQVRSGEASETGTAILLR